MFDRVNSALCHVINAAGIEIPCPQQVVYNKFDAKSEVELLNPPTK